MAYIINKTDGSTLVTLENGTLDTSTSMYLIGKNYPGYGELQQENFIRLLESSANTTSPTSPLKGQLWYDTAASALKVFDGTRFKTPGGTAVSATAPNGPQAGDLWWDITNDQLKVYSGTVWMVVGPAYSKLISRSGPVVDTLFDVTAQPRTVVSDWLENVRLGVQSSGTFIPNAAVSGFSMVHKGYNFNSDAAYPFTMSFEAGIVQLTNHNSNKDIDVRANIAGIVTTALKVNGATGQITVLANPTSDLAVSTKLYVDQSIFNAISSPTGNVQVALSAINANIAVLFANTVAQQTSLTSLSISKAPLADPLFTGNPRAPTRSTADRDVNIATTAFVKNAIAAADDAKWQGSTKYVSTSVPTAGVGVNGDIWFQI